ncbi:MAG: hypothetical protein IJY61_00985 [Candidatus Gastranaerophilales bacterium]|nr:hypothetical protein [Candidatus Gastranaerophilales bacterium]
MNKKHLITLFILILATMSTSNAIDYIPEMGMDPYYSLNELTETNEEDFPVAEDNIINLLKKRQAERALEKQERAKIRAEKKAEKKALKEQAKLEKEQKKLLEQENLQVKDEKSSDKKRKGAFWWLEETEEDEEYLTEEERRKKLEKELIKEEKEKLKALEEANKVEDTRTFWEKLGFSKKEEKKQNKNEVEIEPTIELSADYMEYFPDRYEVEAVGNAKVDFKAQGTVLTANKIVFNYDRNVLKANQDVVITSNGSITEGDFVKIDLTRPNGWIENPITTAEDILVKAKEGYIYSDKIEEYDGVAKILKDDVIKVGGKSFANYMMQSSLISSGKVNLSEEAKGLYKLKANKIIIDSKDEHEVITVKNADLYLKNRKLASIPSMKIVTNKQHASAETNLPEFGSQNKLGMHIGPAVLLNVPGGSTLKLAPILTYADDDFGIGGIARFRNQYNMTEVAYGTSKENFLIRGQHKIAPGLKLNYSRYTNQSEWFLGHRMPKYSTQLSYSRMDKNTDLGLRFEQMYSAGVFVDRKPKQDFGDAEGRFSWMTRTTKPVYTYLNEEGNIGFRVSLVAQTVARVYTTGDTLGLLRVGPSLRTKVGPWNQTVSFLQTGKAGETPFAFDRYRYGRSNLILRESIQITKYLALGYLCSIAMNKDYPHDKTFQENRIFVSIGPEYAKLAVGFDAKRKNTMFMMTMLVGTKDSDIEFKKAEVINPQKLGQEKKKNKKKKKDYKKYLKDKETL